ncbi:MAG: hypothetical protein K1W00_11995 [Lachnospiraceae bacterium]
MVKNIVKKIMLLGLAAVLAAGSYMSVLAAVKFNVTEPSLARLGVENYVVSGSASCSSDNSTSYYMVDRIYAFAYENNILKEYENYGYGYGVASAMTDSIKTRPAYRSNTGWYRNGTKLVEIDEKIIYN